MPYQGGKRLPGERASKLGHLDVLRSELVNSLIENFESRELPNTGENIPWESYSTDLQPLKLIFAVDGSLQIITSEASPLKQVAFVKTALFRLDQVAIKTLDPQAPHPLALRDIMADSALYHATAFPLKNISLPGLSNYNAVRQIIFDSLKDELLAQEPMETLKWLAYEKWDNKLKNSPKFECPHCGDEIKGLSYDSERGYCEHCSKEVYLTDMLGFHLEMAEEAIPQTVASAYMLIHETLLLFTGIRHFWEAEKFSTLQECLFIKDGPLSLRAQYSKLVDPIRNLFEFARMKNITIHMIGQEKSGAFFDHFQAIAKHIAPEKYFLLSNEYVRNEVQQRPDRGEAYGHKTNYGNKVFVKVDKNNFLVLSIPTGAYNEHPRREDYIGLKKILGALHTIASNRHEGALIPVELANGIASLSTYPSAKILKIFSGVS